MHQTASTDIHDDTIAALQPCMHCHAQSHLTHLCTCTHIYHQRDLSSLIYITDALPCVPFRFCNSSNAEHRFCVWTWLEWGARKFDSRSFYESICVSCVSLWQYLSVLPLRHTFSSCTDAKMSILLPTVGSEASSRVSLCSWSGLDCLYA